MTRLPHEVPPPPGPLADRAAALAALVPVLETARTRLRAPALGDFPAWAEILCSDRAAHMDGPYDRDTAFVELEASVGAWALRGHGCWTVEDRATGEPLGFVCLNMEPSDRETELGYFFRDAAEGRGLALEAATAARDWAWGQGLPSLVSYVDPENARSGALAARLGAARDPHAEAEFAGTPDAGVAVWRHPRPEARP
jgi:RimJ/RimL family protein N-acetyltransferase